MSGPGESSALVSDAPGTRSATISDVDRCYRLLLGREIENVAVAGQQIAASQSVAHLYERIWQSREAQIYRMGQAAALMPALLRDQDIPHHADPEVLDQFFAKTFATWNRRGFGSYDQWLRRNEPHFDERSQRWNRENALRAGEAEAQVLLDASWCPPAADVAVFGRQAYRLGAALRGQAKSYVHFEAFAADLEQGRTALRDCAPCEVRGHAATDLRDARGTFDLFYSVSALQYAPPPVMAELLRLAVRALRPGGVLVCQLACQLHDYRFDAEAYRSGVGVDPMGEIHALPQQAVLAILEAEGAVPLEVVPDGRLGSLGLSFSFVARRRG